jgi:hypothetical protein
LKIFIRQTIIQIAGIPAERNAAVHPAVRVISFPQVEWLRGPRLDDSGCAVILPGTIGLMKPRDLKKLSPPFARKDHRPLRGNSIHTVVGN